MRHVVRRIRPAAGTALLALLFFGSCDCFDEEGNIIDPFTGGKIVLTFGGFPLASQFFGEGVLQGPNNTNLTFNSPREFDNVAVGDWTAMLDDVTRGGHGWTGSPASMNFNVTANQTFQVQANYTRTTAQYDFNATGLRTGTAGPFGSGTIGSNTFEINTNPFSYISLPGALNVTYNTLDPNGYRWQPAQAMRSITLQAAIDFTDDVEYMALRGRVDVMSTGLPAGVTAPATITGLGQTYNPSIPGTWYYNVGLDYMMMVDPVTSVINTQSQRIESYSPVMDTYMFDVAGGEDISLTVDWELDNFLLRTNMNWAVKVDFQGHDPFLSAFKANNLDFIVTTQVNAPAGSQAFPLAIVGPPGWVPLFGTYEDDATFSASGSGVVAGYQNVPVSFTGAFAANGALTGEIVVGQDTQPTGLPGGSITYTVTGSRVAPAPNR